MLRKPELEVFGVAAYIEHKEMGDNYMELKYFCVKEDRRGLGIRFMQ